MISKETLTVVMKTTRQLARERREFMAPRMYRGWEGAGQITYLAHGEGYVMVRRPGRFPFCISEAQWLSYERLADRTAVAHESTDHENKAAEAAE
jgi:hypothetical protein